MRQPLGRLLWIAALLISGGCASSTISDNEAHDFRPLFNGLNLDGWKTTPDSDEHWSVQGENLVFDGIEGDLWTLQDHANFELFVSWKWAGEHQGIQSRPLITADGDYRVNEDGEQITVDVEERDSGIYLRGNSKSQVNIWEWPVGSGEVYGYRTDASMPAETRSRATPSTRADKPVYEWNTFFIRLDGQILNVRLNGVQVLTDCPLPGIPDTGPIGLQAHGSAIEFRNILIRTLPK